MKNISFILFFICLALKGFSQSVGFLHFSTDKGLASSEVYSMVQDNDGYMWFGTSRGVSKFDGDEFETFSASNGLPSNSVIEIMKDRFDRIWFANFDGSLSYYKNGKFTAPHFNAELKKIDKNYFVRELYVDEDSVIWISPARGGIYKIFPNGKIEEFKPQIKGEGFFIKDFGDAVISTLLGKSKESDTLNVIHSKNEYLVTGVTSGFRKHIVKIRDGDYLFSIGNKVFHLRNNNITEYKKFNSEVSNIFVDNENRFWISLMYNGVHLFPNSSLEYEKAIYLKDKTPSKVYQDFNGGYWITTASQSIFYAPAFQFTTYEDNSILSNVSALMTDKDFLYFGNYKRMIYKAKYSQEKINFIDSVSLVHLSNYPAQDIAKTSDGIIWILQNNLLIKYSKKTEVYAKLSQAYKLFTLDTFLFVASTDGVHIFTQKNHKIKKYNDFPVANCVYADDTDKIWIGTINGLYLYKSDKIIYLGKDNSQLRYRINDIRKINNYLLLATNGNGLIIYNEQNGKTTNLTKENLGLSSDFINTIAVDGRIIWAGTNNGLCRINFVETADTTLFYVDNFLVGDGLYAKEIKDIAYHKNTFFLATNRGLVSFNSKKLKKNNATPILLLDSIVINDRKVGFDSVYKIKAGKNNVNIYYNAICFYAGNQVVYQYKLQGYDDKWITTKDRLVRFARLPAGKYTFYLRTSADGKIWSNKQIVLKFEVRKKFTQTFSFYALLLLLIFIIAFAFLSIRFSTMQKDLLLKRKMLHSEQKALRAQMNPHFIFNALNSIRRYILIEDTENADDYLTKFALLMRKVLENSKHEFIPLQEEIETLRLYMELEKMRFDESFTFDIEIDQELNLSMFSVPPMIIQPVIENAVWHGLAPLQKDGRLSLIFKKMSETAFMCTVSDNGIGRKKSMEITQKRKKHKSTGIKNLQERINLINEIGIMHIEYKTIDLFDTEGKPAGTKVEITFSLTKPQKKNNSFFKIFDSKLIFKTKKRSK